MVTYVTAHEIGHQWWAHQVISADQQGGTFIVESLAQYSALMVMEQMYGPEQIRKFLKFELDRYLRSRGGEVLEELPLVRVENQPYIHYQKGGTRDVPAEGPDRRGARSTRPCTACWRSSRFKPAPYANSTDLLRQFREVAGPEHEQLIADLFEKITLYDVKVTEAKSSKPPDGRWEVTLEVDARKLYADGKGKETESPLDGDVRRRPVHGRAGSQGLRQEQRLARRRMTVRSGKQTLRIVADREPRSPASIRSTNGWIGIRTTT